MRRHPSSASSGVTTLTAKLSLLPPRLYTSLRFNFESPPSRFFRRRIPVIPANQATKRANLTAVSLEIESATDPRSTAACPGRVDR